MIDTDKYEGHTPAPWKALFNHPDSSVEGSCVVSDEDESNFGYTDGERILGPLWVGELTDDMPDTKLIADAPLLLEEVKRLRNIVSKFDDAIYYHNRISKLRGIWRNLLRELTKEEEE